MRRVLRCKMVLSILALVLAVCSLSIPTIANALDDYVAADDAAYSWSLVSQSTVPGGGGVYQISLTSQVWHGITWRHRLQVVMPAQAPKFRTMLLYITGGSLSQAELAQMGALANKLQAPVATLFDIPNQPLFNGLSEDALISYTFAKFFETGDTTWPALLPMVKGAVKAMDALTEFAAQRLGFGVDGFVVFGGSKRGWTTWLTAAVDSRVKAIAPIAYDNLRLAEQMTHQIASFGQYSLQIHDYTDMGLQAFLNTERGRLLISIIDPYAYKDRYTGLPKLIIRGTNDPYWPVDAIQLYLNDLPGKTWVLYDPGSGHAPANLDRVIATIGGFYLNAVGALSLPPVTWQVQETTGHVDLQVSTPSPAFSLNLWTAVSASTDFRQSTWTSEVTGPGTERVFSVAPPATGAKAVFGEVVYRISDTTVAFDTPVFVIKAK